MNNRFIIPRVNKEGLCEQHLAMAKQKQKERGNAARKEWEQYQFLPSVHNAVNGRVAEYKCVSGTGTINYLSLSKCDCDDYDKECQLPGIKCKHQVILWNHLIREDDKRHSFAAPTASEAATPDAPSLEGEV